MKADEFFQALASDYERNRQVMAIWRADDEHMAIEEITSASVRSGQVILHADSHDGLTGSPRTCRGNIIVSDLLDLLGPFVENAEVRLIFYSPELGCICLEPVVAMFVFCEAVILGTQSYVDLAEQG